MTLEKLTEQIKQKFAYAPSIDAKLKFDLGDEGILFIDATKTPPEISHEDAEADTTFSCTPDVFEGILNGTQDPNIAFMMGKLKIQGSMGLAMKLNSILED